MHSLPLGSASPVWSNTHPRNTFTIRVLSLADKPGTRGGCNSVARGEDPGEIRYIETKDTWRGDASGGKYNKYGDRNRRKGRDTVAGESRD